MFFAPCSVEIFVGSGMNKNTYSDIGDIPLSEKSSNSSKGQRSKRSFPDDGDAVKNMVHTGDSDSKTEQQPSRLMVLQKTPHTLITIAQPPGYEYINARGIDNRTGQEIISIIHLDKAVLDSKRAFKRSKKNTNTTVNSIIYLSGEIYRPSLIERILISTINVRVISIVTLLLLFLFPIFFFCTTGNLCYISDEGNPTEPSQVVWTNLDSSRDIAANVVWLHEADRVDREDFGSSDLLTVVRSYPITITVDGDSITANVLDETLEQALQKLNIDIFEEDIISVDMSYLLNEDDEVTIQRVTYVERQVEIHEIPFTRIARQSPLLSREKEEVLREGVNGSEEHYYLDRYVDDLLESNTLIEVVVLEPAIDELYLTGDPLAAASFFDGSKYCDVEIIDGIPDEYEDIIEDAICTAYSFGPNTFGASGMKLIQGFVATNPDIIPYGTLMYIASDRFTYGWAVAADCGTAMMEGYVDIDCYFETYTESVMFGKKLLTVYIIKQLTQTELEEYAANGMFYGRVPKYID